MGAIAVWTSFPKISARIVAKGDNSYTHTSLNTYTTTYKSDGNLFPLFFFISAHLPNQ